MDRTLRVFSTFEEAERADREYYRSLSGEERLDILLELVDRHGEDAGAAAEGLERVYRVVELSRS